MKYDLINRVAVVTGGAQGLGEGLSLWLAQEGCDVVVADVREDQARIVAERIRKTSGRRAIAVRTDVTREEDVSALFDRAVSEFGRVDIAVANAAILIAEPVDTADAERWRSVLNVNLFGYFLTAKHAARVMKPRRSGVIIQINSKSGKKGSAANSAYAASKFGGIGLTQSLALELAPHGIRCNAICPGNLLDSPLWTDPEKGLFVQYLQAGKVPGARSLDDVRRAYIEQVPLRRGCTVEDVAQTLGFLCSDAAAYMTGQAINVTGGQEMR
jgi:sorbitol-6-phosphate 2-dehydrogenase